MSALDTAEQFLKTVDKNPFSRSPNYQVHVEFCKIVRQWGEYNDDAQRAFEQGASGSEVLKVITPGFQRDNDRWTVNMQRSFVENALAGCHTDIELYSLGGMGDSKVLDGLQRSTAIVDFQEGRFTVYGGYSYRQIATRLATNRARINFKIFTFASEIEAVDFYIQRNENITHSAEDIAKARRYRESLLKNKESLS